MTLPAGTRLGADEILARAPAEDPHQLSPGWLKIDPSFDPLRKNLRFQKLVAGGK
jgi:hypothetical protein